MDSPLEVAAVNPSAAPPQPKVHDARRGEGGAALSSVGSLQRSPQPSLPHALPTSSSCSPRPREIARTARRFSEVVDQMFSEVAGLLPRGTCLQSGMFHPGLGGSGEDPG